MYTKNVRMILWVGWRKSKSDAKTSIFGIPIRMRRGSLWEYGLGENKSKVVVSRKIDKQGSVLLRYSTICSVMEQPVALWHICCHWIET